MRGHVRRRERLLDVAVYGLAREAWARLRAELVADGGERALSADFFRSAEFHAAEEVTHYPGGGGPAGGRARGERDPGCGRSARRHVGLRLPRRAAERRAARPGAGRLVGQRARVGVPARRASAARRACSARAFAARCTWWTRASRSSCARPTRATCAATSASAMRPPRSRARRRWPTFEQRLHADDGPHRGERPLLLHATTTSSACSPASGRSSCSRARRTAGARRGRSWSRATATCTTSSAARRTSCSSTRPSRPRWRR